MNAPTAAILGAFAGVFFVLVVAVINRSRGTLKKGAACPWCMYPVPKHPLYMKTSSMYAAQIVTEACEGCQQPIQFAPEMRSYIRIKS